MPNKEDIALRLDEARRGLEEAIANAVRRHESRGNPIEINLNLVETPDSGAERAREHYPELYEQVMQLVNDFLQRPEVRDSGMSIYKLQALDSDGDGSVAVKVQYEYAVDTGMRDSDRSAVGGTG